MKERLLVQDSAMYLKSHPQLRIAFIEQWMQVVAQVHIESRHLGCKDTLDGLRRKWVIDLRAHVEGIKM